MQQRKGRSMYKVGVDDVGLRVGTRCNSLTARRQLESALQSKLEIVDHFKQGEKKKDDQFSVHFAWISPARLGRFTSIPVEADFVRDVASTGMQPLTFSEMVVALHNMGCDHVQRLFRITNYENRARCLGVRNGDLSRIPMASLGSVARVGDEGTEHLIFIPKGIKENGMPQLRVKRSNPLPLLWVFPVRPVVEPQKVV